MKEQHRRICSVSKQHDFSFTPAGLHVHPTYPHLGASPDGLISYHCCGDRYHTLVTVVVVAVVVVDEEDILDLEWTTDIRECTRPRMTPHNHMLP